MTGKDKTMESKIKIGISACLLGQEVRYDATHQLNRFLTDTLGKYVDFYPVCSEVESGFSTPREAFRLVGEPDSPRLVTINTGEDHTRKVNRWSRERVTELEKEDLCGFIFKKKSPSCGMERVKVYSESGMPRKSGIGLFAFVYMEHFPLVPVEDDGRLNDPGIRENFIERIFTLKRWREAITPRKSRGALVDFHTRQKLLILSHSPKHYKMMGTLVAESKQLISAKLYDLYEQHLMAALRLKSTPGKNSNVLQHILGYFKKNLSAEEKRELLEIVQHYREGLIPLIVPLTLVNHYVRKYDQPYLKTQAYLNPHPIELQLRNHV
jgi:uncharacterized protein YbgA (DUF1722 family)/uncharacterized protein YbbK (DUF523 family)